ncbi:MAG: DegV family protein [Anaerolineae bacterium]|nr:DegV family protein [Anaerolineae bacterium]
MGSRVRIITDGVADLPPDVVTRLGIKVVPIHLFIGGHSYRSDTFTDRELLYRSLQDGIGRPQTASPSMHEFVTAYTELANEGATDIIGLFVASNLSGLSGQALLASQQFHGARLHLVETGQVSMGVGLQAIYAANLAAQGAPVAEILPRVQPLAQRTYVMGMLGALEHLRASGRVSWAQAWLGDLLQIKPLITLHLGEARLWGRVRTYRNALLRIISWVREAAPLEHLAVLHTLAPPEILEEFREALLPFVDGNNFWVCEAGPVFLSHIGPTGLGVAAVKAVR